jgi:hypothetical protein
MSPITYSGASCSRATSRQRGSSPRLQVDAGVLHHDRVLGDGEGVLADRLAIPAGDTGEAVGDVLHLDVQRGGVEQVQAAARQHALPGAGSRLALDGRTADPFADATLKDLCHASARAPRRGPTQPGTQRSALAARGSARHSRSEIMALSRIVMRLARNPGTEFADGDDHRGYTLTVPLDGEGRLDEGAFNAAGDSCTVRRFAPADDIEQGMLKRDGESWTFTYGEDGDDEAVPHLSEHRLAVGEYVSVADEGGQLLAYKVTEVVPV